MMGRVWGRKKKGTRSETSEWVGGKKKMPVWNFGDGL
jgi:hypothetical protein